jgi:uncharacterized protein YuzE
METLKILEKSEIINWDYDEEVDVLYLSFGQPQKSLGIDIGEGVILRYNPETKEITGITIIGMREKALLHLAGKEN